MLKNENIFLLKKLIHALIKNGKKEKAVKVFLYLLKNLNKNHPNLSSDKIIYEVFNNIKPIVSIQKIKKSSKVYYLPKIINTEQKINLSISWLLKSINTRKEKTFELRLTNEFSDCFKGKSLTISKKQVLYETIKANRPFLNLLIYK